MKLRLITNVVVTIFAVCSLAACESKKEEKTSAPEPKKTVNPQASAPAPTDPTASMAHAVVIGKSGAAVDLKYDVLNKPEPGKPVEIEIALIPGVLVDSMSVNVVGQSGVHVSGGDANFGKHAIGEAARHKFTVEVEQPDVVYLTVNATAYTVGISSTRSFAIPLIVASPVPAAVDNKTADAKKETGSSQAAAEPKK